LKLTWTGSERVESHDTAGIAKGLRRLNDPIWVLETPTGLGLGIGSDDANDPKGPKGPKRPGSSSFDVVAFSPPTPPEALGDPTFATEFDLRFNYIAGAMAHGISSAELVIAMGQAGLLAFYGAAGLPPGEVESSIARIRTTLLDRSFGANLIHSPYEPALEDAHARLFVGQGVRLVSASAFLRVTTPLVRYRLAGIHERDGRVVTPNTLFAKISHLGLAEQFLAPPPEAIVRELVRDGELTESQAALARHIPLAANVTAEADSGGHTDNRPAATLLSTMCAVRDRFRSRYGDDVRLRVGLAGGIGTPEAVAGAFAMGAAYVLTGSINQACVEAGTSDPVRQRLAEATTSDMTMAPAADMFELGVKLQVLQRGTLFSSRAHKLWELYRAHERYDAIPEPARDLLERQVFRMSFAALWEQTRSFWSVRDPERLARAESDPKRQMALAFRWYLGMSSRWANAGDPDRESDYQIWCGPAIGAFNEWVRDSILQPWNGRRVVLVAHNLMVGAAVLTRAHLLRAQGIEIAPEVIDTRPRTRTELEECLV